MTIKRLVIISISIILILLSIPQVIKDWNHPPVMADWVILMVFIAILEELFILFRRENH